MDLVHMNSARALTPGLGCGEGLRGLLAGSQQGMKGMTPGKVSSEGIPKLTPVTLGHSLPAIGYGSKSYQNTDRWLYSVFPFRVPFGCFLTAIVRKTAMCKNPPQNCPGHQHHGEMRPMGVGPLDLESHAEGPSK